MTEHEHAHLVMIHFHFNDSMLCLPQVVTATAICIVGGSGVITEGGCLHASKTIIMRNAYLIVTLTH